MLYAHIDYNVYILFIILLIVYISREIWFREFHILEKNINS